MSLAERVLENGEDLVAEMEVDHPRQFGSTQIGSVLVSDRRIVFSYLSDGSWCRVGAHDLSEEPFAQYTGDELHSVFISAADSEAVSQLKADFIDEVESELGLSYSMDILEGASRDPPVGRDDCTCERVSSNMVLIEDKNVELGEHFEEGEFRLISCKDCFRIYGRYRHGKKASLGKLFSADWLFAGDLSFESVVELGSDSAYAIHHTPGGAIRVQDAVVTLSHIGSRSEEVVSTYKHDYQHALCYVDGDEVMGYLTWEPHQRGPVLSQLYVREGYRGRGVASSLMTGWYDHVCETDHYFVDESTPGGRAVLSSVGHIDGDRSPAREVMSLTPMAFG